MEIAKDFGDGFVRIGEQPTELNICLGLLAQHRAVQLPDGSIFLKDSDATAAMVIDQANATKYGIHGMEGRGNWIYVATCPRLDEARKDELMNFLKKFIIDLLARVGRQPASSQS